VNGLNGTANGFFRKDKEVKEEKDTPGPLLQRAAVTA